MPTLTQIKNLADDPQGIRRKLIRAEIERRKREERASFYQPQDYQIEFHKSTAARILLHGGNQSGKTTSAVIDCHWDMSDTNPFKPKNNRPLSYRACGDGLVEQVESVLVPQFKSCVPRETLRGGSWETAWEGKFHRLYYKNGSVLHFMSYDQEPGKAAGVPLDGLLLDEANKCPFAFWKELRARLLTRNGRAIFTCNPDDGGGWLVPEIYEKKNTDEDVECFQFHTEDNQYADKDGVARLIADIGDDEVERAIRLHGDFLSVGGLVYPILKKELHQKTAAEVGWNPSWTNYVAIDPAPGKKGHAALWGAVGPGGQIHFYDQLRYTGLISEFCERMRVKSGIKHVQGWRIDGHWNWDNATARSSKNAQEPLNIEREFINHGIPVIKAPTDVRKHIGIDMVRARLRPDPQTRLPAMTFEPELVEAWEEMRHYSYRNPTKKDEDQFTIKLRQVDDDFPDCVRILVTSNPTYEGRFNIRNYQSQVVADEYGCGF